MAPKSEFKKRVLRESVAEMFFYFIFNFFFLFDGATYDAILSG